MITHSLTGIALSLAEYVYTHLPLSYFGYGPISLHPLQQRLGNQLVLLAALIYSNLDQLPKCKLEYSTNGQVLALTKARDLVLRFAVDDFQTEISIWKSNSFSW